MNAETLPRKTRDQDRGALETRSKQNSRSTSNGGNADERCSEQQETSVAKDMTIPRLQKQENELLYSLLAKKS